MTITYVTKQAPAVQNIKRMSSVEIAALTGKQHFHVIRDIKLMLVGLYGAEWQNPELDAKQIQVVTADNGMTKEIKLDEEHTLTLVSGYEVKLRKAIISRWKELENQVSSQFTIPSTFSEALQLAADQAKTIEQQTLEIEKQAAQIEQDKPKVDFANVISNTPATCKVEEFAKAMGTGRNTLFSWLRNQKILQLSNAPYQQYIDSGYFVYDEKEPYKVNENIKTYFITLITGKGQVWLEKKMQEKGYFSGK